MSSAQLQTLLIDHTLWLRGSPQGDRARLSGADLTDADLSGADLTDADLSGADLSGADLSGANLYGTDLSGADLSGADLSDANLSYANLSKATMPSPEQPTSLPDAAERVAAWLARESRWLQSFWIQTPTGAYAGDYRACLHGAAVYLGGAFGPALARALTDAGYTEQWNDSPERTLADVLAALKDISQNCEA